MKQTQYTREQVNRAIAEVISTQFKKDAKEAHKIVTEAGYRINKQTGGYFVRSAETTKFIEYGSYYSYIYGSKYYIHSFHSLGGYQRTFTGSIETCPVDFVGILDTPINREYRDMIEAESDSKYHKSNAVQTMEKIQDGFSLLEAYDRDIEKQRKIIEEAQNSIQYYMERRASKRQEIRGIYRENHIRTYGETASRLL